MSTQLSTDTATEAPSRQPPRRSSKSRRSRSPTSTVPRPFYQRLGWRLDIDFKPTPETRGVQFTPPGSPASIQFGEGIDDDDRAPAGH